MLFYFLKISPGNGFVLDLSEVDIAMVVSWVSLQVDWTPGVVNPVVGSESLASRRLPDPHVKLSVSHASRIRIWECQIADVCLLLLSQAHVSRIHQLQNKTKHFQ